MSAPHPLRPLRGACAASQAQSSTLQASVMRPGAWLLLTSFLPMCPLGCGRAPSPTVSTSAASSSAAAPTGTASEGDVLAAEACALPSSPVTSQPGDESVEGGALEVCSEAPMTGWFRDGKCSAGADDTGRHLVCAKLTTEFLEFSRSKGNDLITPRGAFPGFGAGPLPDDQRCARVQARSSRQPRGLGASGQAGRRRAAHSELPAPGRRTARHGGVSSWRKRTGIEPARDDVATPHRF